MFKLVIEDDEGNKTVVPVIRDEITIGREDGNTIRLTERNVSRNHARLVRDDGAVFLEDVSARYGTRKNGDRIDGRTDFGPGDVFTIGDYRLTLQAETAPEANKPKKPNGAPPLPGGGEFPNQPTQITKADSGVARRSEGGTEIIETEPARLVIVSSNFAGQEFPLSRREMVIGRGEECDIIIDHRSVSQKHAKVVREDDGGYKIVDLKSKNGVKVGGEEYRAVHLKRGDIVELGHVKFRFVESGENYVFTPQSDEDVVPASSGRSSPMLGVIGAALFVLVVAGVAYMIMSGDKEPINAVAQQTTTAPPATTGAAKPPPEEMKNQSADEMIAKAKEKYLAGKVFEASGILEAAKVQPDLSPEQVDEIDDLLSKARREKVFARSFENGKDHFNNQRWMDAVRDFHTIPPDPPSNIYKLMTDEKLKQQSIEKVLENAVLDAKDARDIDDIEDALAGPQELAQMFPDNEEIAAVVEQIIEEGKRFDRRPVAVKRPKKNNNASKKPTFTKDPTLIEPLRTEALQATMSGNNAEAISKAKEAVRHGCGAQCYRILGTAYKKAGNTEEACKWYGKAGTDSGLDCP